ncbi:MAG: FAD-dependent oxidoreductase [Dehalococcoidales bacterium]|nr:FAD-dependent oxidoreductase [Dehalococcoidales bacterium]
MMNTSKYDVDVLVAGGGVAGVSAALSAARSGMRTLLLESQISLGGLATNGYVTGVAGEVVGNCQEWLGRMDAEGCLINRPHLPAIDPDKGKFILEQMLLEAGARILYGAYVIDAVVENNTITEVICHSKSGRMAVSAGIFIDTTGDADVAAYAGAPYEVGSPQYAGLNMSTTMAFRMANVNMTRYNEASREWTEKESAKSTVRTKSGLVADLQDQAVQNGDLPYFIFPGALIYNVPQTPEEDADISIMITHSYYARNTDAEDLTRQIIEQHQQITWMEKFFRKYIPGFEKSRVTGIANLHGVRDSRRIVGEYILKDEDVFCSHKFEDGICRFPEYTGVHHPTSPRLGFCRHIHLNEPKAPAVCRPAGCTDDMHPFVKLGGYEAWPNRGGYCDIPYRSLVPLKIDNLLVAGRCCSAEFHATTAVRIIAPCMTTGQAAGLAASMCVKDGLIPRTLDGKLVRKAMIDQGVPLDKEFTGFWADMKKEVRDLKGGDFVVLPGDFAAMLSPDGKVMM